jgi:protoporphyrinogen oxidase
VYDFIARRFSPRIAETLVDPMASGIYGGNIRQLSMRSCFGLIYDKEQQHGSVLRSMFFHTPPVPSTLFDGTPKSQFVLTAEKTSSLSFERGMQTLTDTLASHIEVCTIDRSRKKMNTRVFRFISNVEDTSTYHDPVSVGAAQHGDLSEDARP